MATRKPPPIVELEWITPLLWMDPPFEVVQKIRREAAATIRYSGAAQTVSDPALTMQRYLRRVFAETSRRLKIYDIAVEGETW